MAETLAGRPTGRPASTELLECAVRVSPEPEPGLDVPSLERGFARVTHMARMMRSKFEIARMYRERAEKLRFIADGLNGKAEREFLIELAADNDRLAASAEARGRRGYSLEASEQRSAAGFEPEIRD